MSKSIYYYVVSKKHTRDSEPYITLWNPNNAGYCGIIANAGLYSEKEISESQSYYNNDYSAIAVPVNVLDEIAVLSETGYFDEDGYIIPNTKEAWAIINANKYGGES